MTFEYREPVTLLARPADPARSAVGDVRQHYAPVQTLWAEVKPLQGGEVVQGNAVQSAQLWRFTFRRWLSIDAQCRLEWNGQTFGVVSVVDPGDKAAEIFVTAKLVDGRS